MSHCHPAAAKLSEPDVCIQPVKCYQKDSGSSDPTLESLKIGSSVQVELGAARSDAQAAVCCVLDPEMQPGAEDSSASTQKAAANQTLALSAGTELQASALIKASRLPSAASSLCGRLSSTLCV